VEIAMNSVSRLAPNRSRRADREGHALVIPYDAFCVFAAAMIHIQRCAAPMRRWR
jgi:hypothetical protein